MVYKIYKRPHVWQTFSDKFFIRDSRKLVYYVQLRNQLYVTLNQRLWVNDVKMCYNGFSDFRRLKLSTSFAILWAITLGRLGRHRQTVRQVAQSESRNERVLTWQEPPRTTTPPASESWQRLVSCYGAIGLWVPSQQVLQWWHVLKLSSTVKYIWTLGFLKWCHALLQDRRWSIIFGMWFVLKFGAWRMSVFATDRRYSDNGIFIVSSSLAVLHVKPSANKVTSFHICVMRTNNALASS